MANRLRIFSRYGSLLSEFDASVARAWVIGERTTASFTISTGETYCNGTVLNFGNWVVVEHDTLPVWVGTIASREWNARTVTIAAYSPEWFLSQRIGEVQKVITSSAGNIFVEILEQANREQDSLLTAGDIFRGEWRQETINPTSLDKDLKRIHERSREEYSWDIGFEEKGNLIVYGHWSNQLGRELTFTLYESSSGGNIEANSRVLVEDAPTGNYIFGYGNGLTWLTKPYAIAEDTASQAKYGLIMKSISYYGLTTVDAITANAFSELQIRKNPSSIYNVTALDVGDTLRQLKLGNTMFLKMQNVGFTNGQIGTSVQVRIVGMYYDPRKGESVDLALEVQEQTL